MVEKLTVHVEVNWLLIFDNADGDEKEELLNDFWPTFNNGSILITSRDHNIINEFGGTELRELDEGSAVNLLLNMTKFNRGRFSKDALAAGHAAAKQIVETDWLLTFRYQSFTTTAADLLISSRHTAIVNSSKTPKR